MIFKKYSIFFLAVLLFGVVVNANPCPKWLTLHVEDGVHAVIPIYNESITGPDMDCDEILDSVDTDIDGDGVSNTVENANGTNPRNPDSDGDGVSDGNDDFPLDASEATDTDGDGIGNNADSDDDGDGTVDVIEIASGTDPLDANSHPTPFKITVTTSNTSFTIPTYPAETYKYILKCEDSATAPVHIATGDYTCTYDAPGTYTILILDANGDGTGFPGIYFNNSGDKDKIVGINQWGTGKWKRMDNAFHGCSNLGSIGGEATDTPNLSQVSYLNYMFAGASRFNQDIGGWNTSHILEMSSMFSGAAAFDQDIGDWDTSHVQSMSNMFNGATAFDQNIGGWDTGDVAYMSGMFSSAISFNQDIGDWNTRHVWLMDSMFNSATAFDQNIGGWDTSEVRRMQLMFYSARNFNQDIGDWNTSQVENMQRMFNNARVFNQDIGGWNTTSVKDMDGLFASAISFTNQDLSNWDVYKVNRHHFFFSGAGIGNIEPKWPHFIITVKTDNYGTSADNQFTIPTMTGEIYNYNVDCNNDGIDEVTGVNGDYTCTYASEGTYTIVIKDNTGINLGFPHIYFNGNNGDTLKIVGINQWGTGKWSSMYAAFMGCKSLNAVGGFALDTPNLSSVADMYMNNMFSSSTFNQDISDWNTSIVTNMNSMLYRATSFTNHDLSGWDVSNVASHDNFMTGAGAGNTEPNWP